MNFVSHPNNIIYQLLSTSDKDIEISMENYQLLCVWHPNFPSSFWHLPMEG